MDQQNIKVQKWVMVVSIILLALKCFAYYITQSVSILTDALESIVNVVAGGIGLYSLILSARPRDFEHPYGHGKVEFISAAVEGTLISTAGISIIVEAIRNLSHPDPLKEIDYGIYIIAFSALVNFIMGTVCIRIGKQNNSIALEASGKHLQSDTYSTLGIVAGLIIVYVTGISVIDIVVAILMGTIILYTGFKILRSSIAGIMDEADINLLKELVVLIQKNRRDTWIDLHNFRLIKYGAVYHIDCHLTVPYYYSVEKAHDEIQHFEHLLKSHYNNKVELFIHMDNCRSFSCAICSIKDCAHRKEPFKKSIEWDLNNIYRNQKHTLLQNA